MKKIILLLILLMAGGGGWWWYTHRLPTAGLPPALTAEEKNMFLEDLPKTWDKVAPRPRFKAVLQATIRIKKRTIPQNSIVLFNGWERQGSLFLYRFTFMGQNYTYASPSPFLLLYDVTYTPAKKWSTLWGAFNKQKKKRFKEAYTQIAHALVSRSDSSHCYDEWARAVNKNYGAFTKETLLTASQMKEWDVEAAKCYRIWFGIQEADVTPAMAQVYDKIKTGSLLYIHKPKGLKLYTTQYRPHPLDDDSYYTDQKGPTTYQLTGSRYHDNVKYVAATYNQQKDTLLFRVNFFDDVMPLKPSAMDYHRLAYNCINAPHITSDDILLAFMYLDRQLYYNRLKRIDNNLTKLNTTIERLLKSAENSETGRIGPAETQRVLYQEEGLPDQIVRKHYNNLDFLLPAWLTYNSKGGRSRSSGVCASYRSEYGYIVKKGRYLMYIPTVKELLTNTSLSAILSGYGIERIVLDTVITSLAANEFSYLQELRRNADIRQNAAIFNTNRSYNDMAQQAYPEEHFTEGETDVIAKALREFNKQFQNKGGEFPKIDPQALRLYDSSAEKKPVVLPATIQQLGIERRPIKADILYQIQIERN